MNRYIKESNGAVFVDKGGKKYTINDVKIIYRQNILYKYLVGSFIVYKVATWTYYKIKKSFFDDGEFQSNKYSNKKNEKNDQDRENI